MKKKYINKSMYSIQGLRTVSNSLPKAINKILKKGGHNYSSIINNWTEIVGRKTSKICYPKSIKTNKELSDGVLVLNVSHGDQLEVEYTKKDIMDKINLFFGYNFIKQLKIYLIDEKINLRNSVYLSGSKNKKIDHEISQIKDLNLKKKLSKLAKEYENKNSKKYY